VRITSQSILLLLIALSIYACQKDPISSPTPVQGGNPQDTIYYSGLLTITDTVETEEGKPVVIKPGTTLNFGPLGMLRVNGNLLAVGTEDSLIRFNGDPDAPDQLILRLDWETKFTLKHAVITDGLVRSVATENHLQHVQFYNSKSLKWNSALIRLWYGRMIIEDCQAYGNNKGEGILAHNMVEPIVRRCRFERVPDAVEYIDATDGEISSCIFIDNADDAIDQNSCFGTLISDNEFYDTHDRALELGSENFGSSKALRIDNNLFVNCSVAINLKESSDGIVTNATFYSNGTAIDVQTPRDSSRLSGVDVRQSIFIDEPNPLQKDGRSEATMSDNLSNGDQLYGENNATGSISFDIDTDGKVHVTSDTYPFGFDESTMGYQQQ